MPTLTTLATLATLATPPRMPFYCTLNALVVIKRNSSSSSTAEKKTKQKKMSRQGVECPLESGVLGTLYQICMLRWIFLISKNFPHICHHFHTGTVSKVLCSCNANECDSFQVMFKLFTSWMPRGLYLSPSVLVNCRDHTEELVKFFDIKGRAFQQTKKKHQKIKRQHEKQTESVSI